MFQNIVDEKEEERLEENIQEEKIDIKKIILKLFTKQNILVYIISFMLSTISIQGGNGLAPFAISILAARSFKSGFQQGLCFYAQQLVH